MICYILFFFLENALSFDSSTGSGPSIALSLAEALCSIDEESKHTDQINKFIKQTQKPIENEEDFGLEGIVELLGKLYPVCLFFYLMYVCIFLHFWDNPQ
jgi:hypothetical protein